MRNIRTPFAIIISILHLSGCALIPMGRWYGNRERELAPLKNTSEVSVSYGYLSGTDMLNGAGGDEDRSAGVGCTTGNIFGSYHYFLSDRVAIGGTIGYENLIEDWNFSDQNATYNQKISQLTISPEVKLISRSWRNVQFYSLYGFGVTFRDVTYSNFSRPVTPLPLPQVGWNLQFSPMCLSVGNNAGGYGEIGLGYKGLVNIGFFMKLGRRSK